MPLLLLPAAACVRRSEHSKLPSSPSTASDSTEEILSPSTSITSCRWYLGDKYEPDQEVIGFGGSGSVRSATRVACGSRYAIKAIPKDSPRAKSAALREAQLHALLQHPSICRFVETLEDDFNIFLVLELVEGKELLQEVLENGPMSEEEAAEVLVQVLQALEHCHEQGLVHRDVKPENILIQHSEGTKAVRVKLIDFGIAAAIGETPNGVEGTMQYLAPESWFGNVPCSPSLDMWSAGVVLYCLLTGVLPSAPILAGDVELDPFTASELASCSEGAQSLVHALLRPRAADRATASEALKHPWLQSATSRVASG